jgi:SH3 domain protein
METTSFTAKGVQSMNKLIKTGVLVLTGLLFTATLVTAETRFVSEKLTITLRTGPGTDRKIISMLPVGRSVEVVTPGREWTEVVLSNGKKGWVLTQYLTGKEPASRVLARLQQQHARLSENFDTLQKRSSQLSSEGKGLAGELTETQQALSKLTHEYETLKQDSKEFLSLKTKYGKALKDSKQAREEADEIKEQYKQLSYSEVKNGMLIGGGLIVLGFITGYILKRPKRRSPLL